LGFRVHGLVRRDVILYSYLKRKKLRATAVTVPTLSKNASFPVVEQGQARSCRARCACDDRRDEAPRAASPSRRASV
jgi:hypothetical protein